MGALFATFVVTPVLTSILLRENIKEAETLIVRLLHRLHDPALRFALKRRKLTVGIGVVFLAVTALVATQLGGEFLPQLDEGNFWIRAELPMTMTLEDGTAATRTMRKILMRFPEVETVVSQHGRPDDGSDASPFANVEMAVPLKPLSEWPSGVTKDQLTNDILQKFQAALPGVTFNFSQYIQDNIEEAMSGVKGANSIKIIGPNLDVLTRLADQVRDQMSAVNGVTDLGIFPVIGQPDLDIAIDRRKAARYGLNTGDVNSAVQAALGGTIATQVLESDRQFDLVVRYLAPYRDSIDDVGNVKVGYQTSTGSNAYIPLKELATISLNTGASYIYHESGERYIPVKFSVRGRDLAGAVNEAQARIAQNVKMPSGYRIAWSGEFGELQQAQKRLAVIVPVEFCANFWASLWSFQLAAGLFAHFGGHSVRHRRRCHRSLFVRTIF